MIDSAKTLIRVATLAIVTIFAAPALAHEGHDDAPPPKQGAAVPRLVAEGSDVELVAVAQGHTLTIYLDRIATNAPVRGGQNRGRRRGADARDCGRPRQRRL